MTDQDHNRNVFVDHFFAQLHRFSKEGMTAREANSAALLSVEALHRTMAELQETQDQLRRAEYQKVKELALQNGTSIERAIGIAAKAHPAGGEAQFTLKDIPLDTRTKHTKSEVTKVLMRDGMSYLAASNKVARVFG